MVWWFISWKLATLDKLKQISIWEQWKQHKKNKIWLFFCSSVEADEVENVGDSDHTMDETISILNHLSNSIWINFKLFFFFSAKWEHYGD